MQNIVIDKPYVFVPPHRGTWWPRLLRCRLPQRLRKLYGIASVQSTGIEKLQASVAAGHGIIVAANHCRPYDPEILNETCRQVGILPYFMASWHLFMQGWLQKFIVRRLGGYSIYREGMDRQALNMTVELLEKEARPIVIFPEGYVSRHNDVLNPLNDGVAFMARSAAKKRAAATPPGQVVVHPVAIRYKYDGDVRLVVEPVLTEIETRLTWRPQKELPLDCRIAKVASGLLALKEIDYFGEPQSGTVHERLKKMIDGLLEPLENEWLKGKREGHTVGRVIKLRAAVLPDMTKRDLPEAERARRWAQLADMYLAQQLACYPPDYLAAAPTPERLLETVERFEEDLTDKVRPHYPLRVHVTIGDAIVANPTRERGGPDPVLAGIESQLKSMLGIS